MLYGQCILFQLILTLRLVVSFDFSFDNVVNGIKNVMPFETCSSKWIPNNLTDLEINLFNNFYGQPLANSVTIRALTGHLKSSPSSPLILSFHGGVGVGKTYLVQFIVNSLYKNGFKSKFVHSYVGSMHFPLVRDIEKYEVKIHTEILRAVSSCPQSLFIFDEVHKLQTGVLNTISSIIRSSKLGGYDDDVSKSIFIFISNIGSNVIMEKTLEYTKANIDRNDFRLSDFEVALMDSAYSKGGLSESDLIKEYLIDHFVPFLPLERNHVELCIKTKLHGMNKEYLYSTELINDVIKEAIIFGPEPENLFSTSGCKRISQKLDIVVFKLTFLESLDRSQANDEL